ncbi:MAG: replication initiation factor domain-containing protein [Phycisphaerae bacterium]
MGRGVDFLAISVPLEVASLLENRTGLEEDRGATKGFKRSQKRVAFGGDCWRKFDPHQSMNALGLDYEGWEFVSAAADHAASWLADKRGRPSRLDVAFDICVSPGMTADAFFDLCAPFITRTTGISGENGVNTRYVGSISSDVRVRIYRKDFQQGLAYANEFGPVLRVELVLKNDRARAWWIAWKSDKAAAFACAAKIIQDVCGVSLGSDFASLPPLPKIDPQYEVAQQIFTFMRQHSVMLAALHASGIQLGTRSASLVRRGGKLQPARLSKLVAQVEHARRHLVLAALDDLLAAHVGDAEPDS